MATRIVLPSKFGNLQFSQFQYEGQIGVIAMNPSYSGAPFIRIHSSCVFSESFGTADCDCALQLHAALEYIGKNGGIVIYLYQEGRGIGLEGKIEAIAIQQKDAIDTASAFAQLGHSADPRTYSVAIQFLRNLGISEIRMATNNPQKIAALAAAGIKVVERISLDFQRSALVDAYVQEKRESLGHHGND